MPRGLPPAWSARDCAWDHLVAAVIRAGPGVPLVYHGIASPERAEEIRRGVYRCGRHRKVSVQVSWPWRNVMTSKTAQWPPDKVGGGYQLTIVFHPKPHGRRHVVTTMGTDRTQWHYDPRARSQTGN